MQNTSFIEIWHYVSEEKKAMASQMRDAKSEFMHIGIMGQDQANTGAENILFDEYKTCSNHWERQYDKRRRIELVTGKNVQKMKCKIE